MTWPTPLQLLDWLPNRIEVPTERLAAALLAFFLVALLGRLLLVPSATRLVSVRNRRNRTLVEAVERYVGLLVLVVATAAALVAGGYGFLLTRSAIVVAAVTLAIGVAGQEVIGDLVAGMFLVADPEFNVGDWIAWEGGEGVVEVIRFRTTTVRTGNGEVITVPNTTLATDAVTRPYSRERFRVVVDVGVSYDDDLDLARRILREEADAVDDVLDDPPPRVVVDELAGDAVHLRCTLWVRDPTREEVVLTRSAYAQRVKTRLQAAGVGISPPSEHDLSGELRIDGDREAGGE